MKRKLKRNVKKNSKYQRELSSEMEDFQERSMSFVRDAARQAIANQPLEPGDLFAYVAQDEEGDTHCAVLPSWAASQAPWFSQLDEEVATIVHRILALPKVPQMMRVFYHMGRDYCTALLRVEPESLVTSSGGKA